MAKIEIQSAFVEPWSKNQDQHPAWGMKTAEPHNRKNDAGQYETVSRTFRTVKVSRASGIDLTQFGKGARVQVWGTEVTEVREHEGKKYYDVVVWADRVELAQGAGGGSGGVSGAAATGQAQNEWGTPQNQDAGAFGGGFDDTQPF